MGGDPPAPQTSESMNEVLKALVSNYPQLTQVAAGGVPILEQAKVQGSVLASPQMAKLQNELFQTFGPQMAETGNQIIRQNALAQATTDRDILAGPGKEVITAALEGQKLADPEFYNTRAAVGSGLTKLLGSINPEGLSGGERAEVERSLNQDAAKRGTLNAPSQTETVGNAMAFGQALSGKRAELANALGVGASSLPAMKSGTDVFQVATGRPSQANTGDNKFMGARESGTDAFDMANNFVNNSSQMRMQQNEINANRRDALDRMAQMTSAMGSIS